jgi:hypothetical protein
MTAAGIRRLHRGGRACVENMAAVRRGIALEMHVGIRVREVGGPLRRRGGFLFRRWLDRLGLSGTLIG